MKHDLFIDGTVKEYSWSIKTGNEIVNQDREHPPAYLSGGKLEIKNNCSKEVDDVFKGYDFLVLPSAQVFPFDKNLQFPKRI